jgi:2',3'-cyclic-nucleotide 2'-phosphodiesterase (5'-nucleotidase family)
MSGVPLLTSRVKTVRRRRRRTRALAGCFVTAALVAGCSSAGSSSSGAQHPSGAAQPNGGASSASPSPSAAPTSPPPPKPITVAFTGDILAHAPVFNQAATDGRATGLAYDFRPMFAKVKAQLSAADLAICHQETALSATDVGLSGYPVFNSPHEIAAAVADAGYDGCSTASNHSYDHGASGVAATIQAFDAVHVGHVGSATTTAGASKPELHTVRGVQVALLDYTYGLNGFVLPTGQGYLVNLIDVPRILRDAHAARLAGAKIVIVQMHWGAEYQSTPTPEQRTQATQLLASPDVDAIVGGHVHVVQPVEKIGAKYVVYGVGNFLSNQSGECCPTSSQDGVIVTLHFAEKAGTWSVASITFTPTYVDRFGGYVIEPDAAAYTDPATSPALKSQLAASFQRTAAVMQSLRAPAVTPDATPPGL